MKELLADEGDADRLNDDSREMRERFSVKRGRDGGHQRCGEAGQRSKARLRVGVVARLGRLGVGVRVHDPSTVHVVRMIEERRRRRVSDEEDTQPQGQSSSYFFSAMHAWGVYGWNALETCLKSGAKKCTEIRCTNPIEWGRWGGGLPHDEFATAFWMVGFLRSLYLWRRLIEQ